MDMSLSKSQETVKDREAWWAVVQGGARSWTRLNERTTTMTKGRLSGAGCSLLPKHQGQLRLKRQKSKNVWFQVEQFSLPVNSPSIQSLMHVSMLLDALNRSLLSRVCSTGWASLLPHGLQPARFLCPWDSPGRSTGVECHFLLQVLTLLPD